MSSILGPDKREFRFRLVLVFISSCSLLVLLFTPELVPLKAGRWDGVAVVDIQQRLQR